MQKHNTYARTGDAFLAFTRGHETRALLSPNLGAFRLCEPASLLALF